MKRITTFLFFAGIALSQSLPQVIAHGEQVFAKTCATGYCHGPKGVSGGAPRLAARGFTQGYIAATAANGVKGTSMPAFAGTLSRADIQAVSAYLATLNGIANPVISNATEAATSAKPLSAEATRGRALFSDAVRGFGRCSTCHELNGRGISVTTPIAKVPPNAAALRSLASPGVSTAMLAGESMPALLVARKAQSVTFYDLTSAPPVLRTVTPTEVQLRDGSTWKHSDFISSYNDAELNAILAYLR